MISISNSILEDLAWRGLVYQSSSLDNLAKRLEQGKITLYAGFDPTADSLHVGHLLPLITLSRFQKFGHQPIAVVGGGTGLIGDPSGKSSERTLNSSRVVEEWTQKIRYQVEPFLNFNDGSTSALLLNNYEWISLLSLIDYLRDIGKFFSVNSMIAKDSVKIRLEREEVGISYTEFSYMLLQAYDYYALSSRYGCELQIGGSDQWGNIVAGMDLIRRRLAKESHAITIPLLVTASGQKFGKTEQGAIWLDGDKTSPYQFYQFFLNVDDRDVITYLKYFTFLNQEEILELENKLRNDPSKREAQYCLAEEVTRLVHGNLKLQQAVKASKALFGQAEIRELPLEILKSIWMATDCVRFDRLITSTSITELLVAVNLVSSKSQARQLISSGGVYINNIVVTDQDYILSSEDALCGSFVLVRKGKKNYKLVQLQTNS